MDYNVIRSRRKTIAIEIDRVGTVTIRAPYRMPNVTIKSFIQEKQDWIDTHLQKIREGGLDASDVEPIEETVLEELYEEARIDMSERVKHYADIMGVDYGRVTIRCQKTRWGSCSSIGNLNFNCLLMLAPIDVRDYVVIHELAHRKYMNHSKDFWKVVEFVMPDYREKRKWLKTHGDDIMQRIQKR